MASIVFTVICLLHSGNRPHMRLADDVLHEGSVHLQPRDRGPAAKLLIRFSDSFSGLLLFAIGFLLFMVAVVKGRCEWQIFFARGCVLLHVSVAVWRFFFERRLEDLALGLAGAFSGVLPAVYTWKDKYD